ncbi:MAG: hypothetical protein ACOX0U_04340 [Oscillospiraceae bacterium]
MNRYKCPSCGGNQYSADPKKESEPCIYCDHQGTELMDNINEDQEGPKEEKNEDLHEQDR